MSIYSRPSFLAEKTLANLGVTVSKGHLREIIAALCGFNSLASLQASPHFQPLAYSNGLLILADKDRAIARSKQLVPDANPEQVVQELTRQIDKTAPPTLVLVSELYRASESLFGFGRRLAMATPEMSGQVDDYELRVRGLTSSRGEGIGGFAEDLARIIAHGNGPLQFVSGSARLDSLRCVARLSAEYLAGDEGGLLDIDLTFRPLTRALFAYEKHQVQFHPGEYMDDVPEFGYFGE